MEDLRVVELGRREHQEPLLRVLLDDRDHVRDVVRAERAVAKQVHAQQVRIVVALWTDDEVVARTESRREVRCRLHQHCPGGSMSIEIVARPDLFGGDQVQLLLPQIGGDEQTRQR